MILPCRYFIYVRFCVKKYFIFASYFIMMLFCKIQIGKLIIFDVFKGDMRYVI